MSNVTDLNTPRDGLPQELLNQLTKAKPVSINRKVLAILQDNDCVMDINEILISFYNQHNHVLKRQAMSTQLYKLVKDKKIKKVGVAKFKAVSVQPIYAPQIGDGA